MGRGLYGRMARTQAKPMLLNFETGECIVKVTKFGGDLICGFEIILTAIVGLT